MAGPRPLPADGSSALAAAAVPGGFFEVARAAGPDWTTWAAVITAPEPLERRMAEIRGVLDSGPAGIVAETAVVGSLTHLGLVARLLPPPLGAALATGVLPVAPPERVWLRLTGANPVPLAVQAPAAVAVAAPADLAAALHEHWLAPAIEPLTRAVQVAAGVSRQVLDGNVVSALASALAMTAAARPDLADVAGATLDAVLRDGPLAGTGRRREDGSFVRRSCCLFYRLPDAGTCADCILTDRTSADRTSADGR